MLTFPEVFTHAGVAVYPDDEDPNLFYLLSGRPRLRVDNGKPVFRALFWTDDASGVGPAGTSVAGLRGALLHFDVNLEVPDKIRDEIKEKIDSSGVQQARVDQMLRDEKERIERMARAQGVSPSTFPKPRIPDVREARFGSVQFLGGKVELLEEKDGGFVAWSSAGGPPSLIGDNNAAFALRLGSEGAAVWYRGLEQDATAIGIRYELKFQARLPSLQIHVWAGSHQKLDIERKAQHVIENMDQGCSDADVARIDVEEVSETLTQEGLINIEIIKGTAKISDEHVSQLRNTAINLISDRVKEVLQHKIRGMTEEERRSSVLKKVTEEVTAFAELRLTQRDVIEWGANPQATITDFLGGLSGDARKKLITLVDLSDPVVSTVEVQVTADADWEADPKISRVIIRVEYPPGRDDPNAVKDFTFTKTDATAQMFRCRRVKGVRGSVNFTAKAFVKGAADPIELSRGSTNGDKVHVEVPALGVFKVKARPHPNMFGLSGAGKISAVEIKYAYKEPGAPDHVAGSRVIRPTELDSGIEIEHVTFRQIDAPIRYKPVYLRDGHPAIEGPEQQVWVRAGRQGIVEIPMPWTDFLQIGARVPPGIAGLKRVRVHLTHGDGSEFQSDGTIDIEEDSGEWFGKTSLVQMNKANQRFKYRYSVEGADQLTVGPWVDAEGDQELVLPLLGVTLRTDRLKLGTDFSEAIVRLTYEDTSRRFTSRHEFFLTKDKLSGTWLVPRVDPNLDSYRYSMTCNPPTGESIEVPEQDGRGTNLILRPPGQ